jgi:S1-C subfamily serine protease
MIDSILLSATQIATFAGQQNLSRASGFFFARDNHLFLVTSRHVLIDEASGHRPDRIEIELHGDPANLAQSTRFSILLYRRGQALWRQGVDSAGPIDVALLKLDRDALPAGLLYRAFTPQHLPVPEDPIAVGDSLLVVGFPLGFHDTLHHMPVGRRAGLASSYGLRFKGEGYFLTDARTHRGTSGAAVVRRISDPTPAQAALPWLLLGVHSARLDVGTRDLVLDESLGLNCAWYADILLTLSKP